MHRFDVLHSHPTRPTGASIFAALCLVVMAPALAFSDNAKPRVIVTTDGETDDRCSMNRFLLYANEWDVLGLIHSSSKHHWHGDGTHPAHKWEPVSWLDRMLDAYAEVHPNLQKHDADYPTADYLRSQVFVGNIAYEGAMDVETPGSNRIVEVLLDADPTPVWIQAWGGPNTIARALKTIAEKHPDRIEDVTAKARLFLISEQDGTYKSYIQPHWPGLTVLRSGHDSYGGIAYYWRKFQPTETQAYFDAPWMKQHLLEGHGALCRLYEVKDGAFRSEGDSPAFLHVIPTGLRSDEDPTFGGWGGRFTRSGAMWKSVDQKESQPHDILRWAVDFQNDWAARADWCVKPHDAANHPPQVTILGHTDKSVTPGEPIMLDGSTTSDPDGNALSYTWWHYREASTYRGEVTIEGADTPIATLQVPENFPTDQTIHIVCTVRDDGTPPLTRYGRVIIRTGL